MGRDWAEAGWSLQAFLENKTISCKGCEGVGLQQRYRMRYSSREMCIEQQTVAYALNELSKFIL